MEAGASGGPPEAAKEASKDSPAHPEEKKIGFEDNFVEGSGGDFDRNRDRDRDDSDRENSAAFGKLLSYLKDLLYYHGPDNDQHTIMTCEYIMSRTMSVFS